MADPAIFRPKPTDEVLYNPHMGFQTFQHFNGDDLFADMKWTEVGPEEFGPAPEGRTTCPDHPYTTVAYLRWYWDQMEPRDGEFRWEIIDGALKTARERGQSLAIRVMCHDSFGEHDVPEWFKRTGARGGIQEVHRRQTIKYWVPDYSDPHYIKHWTRINRELAMRYDGHPDLDTVDLASIGPWGEWSTNPVDPPMSAKAALIDCYTDYWKKTPLLMQCDDAPSMRYGIEKGTGWRADCIGDLRGFGETWCHMHDAYPQGIVYGGAENAWKTAPVSFEVCGVMGRWHERGYDVNYIWDQAVKWHMTTFNSKSSFVPEEWWPSVYNVLKRMGYRFVLRKLLCPQRIAAGSMMRFHMWWENKGCAPIYRKYDLALQLKRDDLSFVMKTDVDVRTWLPGDTVYDDAVLVPREVPAGTYAISVGLIDQWTTRPSVWLAQEGRAADGWYSLGQIEVTR